MTTTNSITQHFWGLVGTSVLPRTGGTSGVLAEGALGPSETKPAAGFELSCAPIPRISTSLPAGPSQAS